MTGPAETSAPRGAGGDWGLLLFLLAGAATLLGVHAQGTFHDYDDYLYAQVARESVSAWHPTWHGVPFVHKPPLYFAILAALSRVFGESLFVLRLPALLSGLACVALVFVLGRRFARSSAAAAGAVGLLLTSNLWFEMSRRALIDVPLVAVALVAGAAPLLLPGRRGLSIAGVAMGVACALKGAAALPYLLVPGLLVGWELWRTRDVLGAVICGSAIGLLTVPLFAGGGAERIRQAASAHVTGGTPGGLWLEGPIYYVEVFWRLSPPWTLAAAAALVGATVCWRRGDVRGPTALLLLGFGAAPLLVLSVLPVKLVHYVAGVPVGLALAATLPIGALAARSARGAGLLAFGLCAAAPVAQLSYALGDPAFVDPSRGQAALAEVARRRLPGGARVIVTDTYFLAFDYHARTLDVQMAVPSEAAFHTLEAVAEFHAARRILRADREAVLGEVEQGSAAAAVLSTRAWNDVSAAHPRLSVLASEGGLTLVALPR